MSYEYKITINGVDYGMDTLAEVVLRQPLFDTFGAGSACCAELTLTFYADDSIPEMGEVHACYRQQGEASWLPMGTYFIDTREESDGKVTLCCYDAMLKADVAWYGESSTEEADWPQMMSRAVLTICERIGVTLDPRTTLNTEYVEEYPVNYSYRDVLSHVAAAHGGNWIITWDNTLYLVPLFTPGPLREVGQKASSFMAYTELKPVSRVTVYYDDEHAYTAGDDTGYELTVMCPTATQEMADALLAAGQGYTYRGYSAEYAALPIEAELGDAVLVNGLESVIANRTLYFDPKALSSIEAPGENEIAHNYPSLTPLERTIKQYDASQRSLITKTAEEIGLRVENTEGDIATLQETATYIQQQVENNAGDISTLQQTASEVEIRVENAEADITDLKVNSGQVHLTISSQEGTLTTTIDSQTWEALYRNLSGDMTSGFYFDFEVGRFVFDGTGVFRGADGKAYIQIEGNELVMYKAETEGAVGLDALRLGFVKGLDPSGTSEVYYPYLLMGNAGGDGGHVGLIKKFWNGLWVGNSYPKNASGNFEAKENYAGFWIDTMKGAPFVVQGTEMKNVYTGAAIARFK